jgi:hypothetical protein
MKKTIWIIGICFLVIILGVAISFYVKEDAPVVNNGNTNWENAEVFDLSSIIDYFEDCYENLDISPSERPENLRFCAENNLPSVDDVEKIKLLDGVKKIEICNIPAREFRNPEDCTLAKEVSNSCNEIFSTSYEILVIRPHPISISVSKCGEDYYYIYNHVQIAGPPEISIFKIKLDNEIATQLNS